MNNKLLIIILIIIIVTIVIYNKYNPIKTNQYNKNLGKSGPHKGICIRKLGYAYAFTKNFKNLCNNDWTNYLYYVIVFFNNPQDIIHANGFNKNII